MRDPQELRIITENELHELPDGARVVDDQGYQWERGGDWWILDHSHTVILTQDLWATSRHVCHLVPYSATAALK